MIQTIYSRYEYPLHEQTNEEVFTEYSGMTEIDEYGTAIGGLGVCIREGHDPAVIILTYSPEADTYLHLKLTGRKDVKYNRYRNG
jgi:hypothetical protein